MKFFLILYFFKRVFEVSVPLSKDDRAYFETIVGMWTTLTTPKISAPKFIDYPLSAAVFDIEVGVLNPQTINRFSTPITGYVQAIGVSCTSLASSLNLENPHHLMLVYKKPGLDFTKVRQQLKELNNMAPMEVIYFSDELHMLKFFIGVLVPNFDVVEGYNSDRFDLPFVSARINLLSTGMGALFCPRKSFYLFKYGTELNFCAPTKFFYYYSASCQHCGNKIYLEKIQNQKTQYEDNKCISCVFCFKATHLDDIDAAIQEVCFMRHGVELTSFSDLFCNKLISSCPSRQLDMVVAMFLKDPVKNIQFDDEALKIEVSTADTYKFIPGTSFRFFKQNLATKNLTMLGEADLISFSDGTLYFPPGTKIDTVDDPEKFGGLQIAPGKTYGGLTRAEQLLWTKEIHVVKTIFYCFIDVMLTQFLSACVKNGAEMTSASVLMLLPFTEVDLRFRSGQKIQMLHADLFTKAGIFQAKIVRPSQIQLYNRALEIEGVKRQDLDCAVSCDRLADYPLVEARTNVSFREIMEMKNENVAEFQLGTMVSVDGTNKKNVFENLNNIIHLI